MATPQYQQPQYAGAPPPQQYPGAPPPQYTPQYTQQTVIQPQSQVVYSQSQPLISGTNTVVYVDNGVWFRRRRSLACLVVCFIIMISVIATAASDGWWAYSGCSSGSCYTSRTTCFQESDCSPSCSGSYTVCSQDFASYPTCSGYLAKCSQTYSKSPTCFTGNCDQTDSSNPSCSGGSCCQAYSTGISSCTGGGCSSNPSSSLCSGFKARNETRA